MSFVRILSIGVFLSLFTWGASSLAPQRTATPPIEVNDSTGIWEIYERLGKIPLHQVDTNLAGFSVERGRELVHQGYTTGPDGKTTAKQSRYFVCTTCHNIQPEFADLAETDPQKRLEYAAEQDIPFLQATTFFGIVNRLSFYNDDYQKKYDHVETINEAQYDIRTAIQLCATECAQGRSLEDWEVESILAYFWTLQIRIGDLGLTETELEKIQIALDSNVSTQRAINILRGHYKEYSPAHFVAEPQAFHTVKTEVAHDEQRLQNGQYIYEQSCLHCHERRRYSFFKLDTTRSSFRHLYRQTRKGMKGSVYKITRYGTSPVFGNKSYMPLYSKEKLSPRQVEDLRLYIQHKAELD